MLFILTFKESTLLISADEASKRSKDLFTLSGCAASASNADLLKCAQKLDSVTLFNTSYSTLPTLSYLSNISGGQMFNSPVIDGKVFNRSVDLIIQSGLIKKCKIITGYNEKEFISLLYEQINSVKAFDYAAFSKELSSQLYYYPNYPNKANASFFNAIKNEYFEVNDLIQYPKVQSVYSDYLVRIMGDYWLICQSFEIAEVMSKFNVNAYVYEFKYLGGEELVNTFGLPLQNMVSFRYFLFGI